MKVIIEASDHDIDHRWHWPQPTECPHSFSDEDSRITSPGKQVLKNFGPFRPRPQLPESHRNSSLHGLVCFNSKATEEGIDHLGTRHRGPHRFECFRRREPHEFIAVFAETDEEGVNHLRSCSRRS